MKLNYSLSENDYLTYQLFTASKSKKTTTQRKKSHVLLIIVFILLSLLSLNYNNGKLFFSVFLIFAFIVAIFYPSFLRAKYKDHYIKYNQENHKNLFGKETEIEITDTNIFTKSYLGESKFYVNIIEYITETKSHIFIRINSGSSFIIPKRIDKMEEFKSYLKDFAKRIKIDYIEDLNWEWK